MNAYDPGYFGSLDEKRVDKSGGLDGYYWFDQRYQDALFAKQMNLLDTWPGVHRTDLMPLVGGGYIVWMDESNDGNLEEGWAVAEWDSDDPDGWAFTLCRYFEPQFHSDELGGGCRGKCVPSSDHFLATCIHCKQPIN